MALTYHPERSSQSRINTSLFSGTKYDRVFTCALGEIETLTAYAGTLALGSVLASAYGGTGGSDPHAPRLQSVTLGRQRDGGMQEIIASYISIDHLADNAGAGDYVECKRRPSLRHTEQVEVTQTVGVATTATDVDAPDIGDKLDGATGHFDPICSSLQIDSTMHAGRVFFIAEWTAVLQGS